MNSFKKFSSALTLSCLCIGFAYAQDPANVAKVTEANGKVLVNKGKGYVTAKQGMEIRPGDRVVALDKASAKVVYNDGCVTDLKENDLLSMDGKGCANSAISALADRSSQQS